MSKVSLICVVCLDLRPVVSASTSDKAVRNCSLGFILMQV